MRLPVEANGGIVEPVKGITNKKDAGTFRKALNKVLDTFSIKESFVNLKALRGRIEQINQMTNSEKLLAPFKILDVPINEDDFIVINSRNDFLHGRVPDFRKLGESRSTEEKDNDLYYASLKLYTILNMLILKFINHDGYVVNYAKLEEVQTRRKLNEDFYRKN